MSKRITIVISNDGQSRLGVGEDAHRILGRMGIVVRKRASHIRPRQPLLRWLFILIRFVCNDDKRFKPLVKWSRTWKCKWMVDLRKSGGRLVGPFAERLVAITYEVQWVNANLDTVYDNLEAHILKGRK